jgi:hypothetical protein
MAMATSSLEFLTSAKTWLHATSWLSMSVCLSKRRNAVRSKSHELVLCDTILWREPVHVQSLPFPDASAVTAPPECRSDLLHYCTEYLTTLREIESGSQKCLFAFSTVLVSLVRTTAPPAPSQPQSFSSISRPHPMTTVLWVEYASRIGANTRNAAP